MRTRFQIKQGLGCPAKRSECHLRAGEPLAVSVLRAVRAGGYKRFGRASPGRRGRAVRGDAGDRKQVPAARPEQGAGRAVLVLTDPLQLRASPEDEARMEV